MALTSLTSLNSLTSPFAKVDVGILHYVFFECLLEIEMIVPKINLIIWAFIARRVGSVCPRLVLSMHKACSADARPLVCKGSCGGTNFFNFFNFPICEVELMIDYLNNVE